MARHTVPVASYVILLRKEHVFLMRRFQTGWMDGHYGLPSGHLEKGETPAATAIREAEEEAGVTLKPQDLKLAVTMHRRPGSATDREYIDFFFTAQNWRGEPQLMEPHKCDEVGWFPLTNLPEGLLPYIRDVISAIRDSRNYLER